MNNEVFSKEERTQMIEQMRKVSGRSIINTKE